jgi:hypothetical protein
MSTFASVTFLPTCFLAKIGETHIDRRREGFMNYAVQMGLGAIICTQNFVKIGPAIQNLREGEYTDTHAAW